MLERAVGLDPAYAPAWTALGQRYLYESQYGLDRSKAAEYLQRAATAQERALALDPNLSEAEVGLILLQSEHGDNLGAYARARDLVRRRPQSARAHFALSYVFRFTGLLEEAMRECDAALALDPHNRSLRSCGNAFRYSGQPDRARDFLPARRGLELGADLRGFHASLGEKGRGSGPVIRVGRRGRARTAAPRDENTGRAQSHRGEGGSRRHSGHRRRAAPRGRDRPGGRRIWAGSAARPAERGRRELRRVPGHGPQPLLRFDPQGPRVRRRSAPRRSGSRRSSWRSGTRPRHDRPDGFALPDPLEAGRRRHGRRLRGGGPEARPPRGVEVPAGGARAGIRRRSSGSSAKPARPPRSSTPTSARSTTSTSTRASPSSRWSSSRAKRCGTASGPGPSSSRRCSISARRSPTRSRPRTRAASCTATSSRRTSSSRSAARRSCSTSASPSRPEPRPGAPGNTALGRPRWPRSTSRAPARPSAPWPTCLPSRRAASRSTRAPTSSPSAPCSTRWPPAASPSREARRPSSSTRFSIAPRSPRSSSTRSFRRSSSASSTPPSKRTGTCATRARPS